MLGYGTEESGAGDGGPGVRVQAHAHRHALGAELPEPDVARAQVY